MKPLLTAVIGKDVIESLTLGMYKDAKNIFREYIQNSADAIDQATTNGWITKNESSIKVTLDPIGRTVAIADNGCGISKGEFIRTIQSIAQSDKYRENSKGFRGIGRLGGLGYCDKLKFETTTKAEGVKSIAIWDALKLKKIINDPSTKQSASDLMGDICEYFTEEADARSHYFIVTLYGVPDNLVNEAAIYDYLSMAAPVPCSPKFSFSSTIHSQAKRFNSPLHEYNASLNGTQIFKQYSDFVLKGEPAKPQIIGKLTSIQTLVEFGDDGQPLYWGWYALTDCLNEQLKSVNLARGIRLRKFNIQIGDETALAEFHKESRGNFYFFGEIHAIHPKLLPNSRRDNFIENSVFQEFGIKLKNQLSELKELYYTASSINNAAKKVASFSSARDQYQQKARKNGFLNQHDHNKDIETLTAKREEAFVAKRELEKIVKKHRQPEVLYNLISPEALTNTMSLDDKIPTVKNKSKFRIDKFDFLNKSQRILLSKVFDVIRDVMDEETSSELVAKIVEELSSSH